MQRFYSATFLLIFSLLFSWQGYAETSSQPSASQIMQQSFDVKRSEDSLSRLTFVIQQKDKEDTRLVFDQVWKEYEKGPYGSKTIYFQVFPPDRKGIAYMGWFPREGSKKKIEEWLYLPELRIVRRMGGNEISNDKKTEDTFDKSEMKESDLIPRNPGLDMHRYLRAETIKKTRYHVIESRPKPMMHHGMGGPHAHHGGNSGGYNDYNKVIHWVRQDNFLPTRIDYYDKDEKLLKRQSIQWQKKGDTWEWKRVATKNLQNDNQTTLDITNLVINVGLNNKVFSKRMMKLGFNRIQ